MGILRAAHAVLLQLVGDGEPLKVDESSLTGESMAVTRGAGQTVLAGMAG
jgi:hypothetical protein